MCVLSSQYFLCITDTSQKIKTRRCGMPTSEAFREYILHFKALAMTAVMLHHAFTRQDAEVEIPI